MWDNFHNPCHHVDCSYTNPKSEHTPPWANIQYQHIRVHILKFRSNIQVYFWYVVKGFRSVLQKVVCTFGFVLNCNKIFIVYFRRICFVFLYSKIKFFLFINGNTIINYRYYRRRVGCRFWGNKKL